MQTQNINEIEINGVQYVKKGTESKPVLSSASIVRSSSAGVFFGEIFEANLGEGWVKIKNARRIWYWDGAASLSQLANDGTAKPATCKFPAAVSEVVLLGVCEIIPCTKKAIESLTQVKEWKQ